MITLEELENLIRLCEEPSYKIPSGLSREERRTLAKNNTLVEEVKKDKPVLLIENSQAR